VSKPETTELHCPMRADVMAALEDAALRRKRDRDGLVNEIIFDWLLARGYLK